MFRKLISGAQISLEIPTRYLSTNLQFTMLLLNTSHIFLHIEAPNPIMITTFSNWSCRSEENKTKFGTQKALIRKQKALQLIHFPQNLCSALNFVLWHFEIFEIFLFFPASIKLPQKKILSFGFSPDFKCKTAAFISSALSLHPRSNNNANLNLGLERSRVPWLLNFYNFYFQFSYFCQCQCSSREQEQ